MRYFIFISLIFIFHNTSFSQICGFKPKDAVRIDDILRGHANDIGLREAITIPVIVHVVRHSTDEIVSDATILSQISILNRDFNAKNGDIQNVPTEFKDRIANVGIHFCLVSKDSMGQPHTGIIRVNTPVKAIGLKDSLFSNKLGGSTAWNTAKYFNIWVANTGEFITGTGSYPTQTPQTNEGVIVHPRYFGQNRTTKFGLGRVAVHEVGHYFGLYHTWGKTRDSICVTDEVADTPPQKSYYESCPTYPQYSCGVSNMFMNFMDYVDDPCMLLFTNGQKARMLATVALFRKDLSQTKVCMPNLNKSLNFTIYPNPTSGNLQMAWDLGINTEGGALCLVNTQGQQIINRPIGALTNELNLDLSRLPNGLYIMSIQILNHDIYFHKIILSK